MSKAAERFFKQMIGNWTINRSIISNDITIGTAEGLAKITQLDSSTLLYKEKVVATLYNSISINATKEYKFVLAEGALTKKFVEPNADRTFYELLFTEEGTASGSHLCEKDHYTALYDVSQYNTFSIRYDILGPEKDSAITTSFCRLSGATEE